MKTSSLIRAFVFSSSLLFSAHYASAGVYYWNWTNGVSPDMNWSSSLNWLPAGVPGSADTAIFNNTNSVATGGLTTIGGGFSGINLANFNSIVDSGFTGTIASLIYSNVAANYNSTYLTNGVTLNVTNTGGFVSGSSSLDFGTVTALTTIAGSNATLNVTNTNAIFFVGLGSAGGGSPVATLDMSALQTFTATVSRFMVGEAYASSSAQNRPGGILYLAATNTITAEYQTGATETSDTVGTGALIVGDTTSNNGGSDYLYLGQNNTIAADTIIIGRQKASNGRMAFNPVANFTNPVANFGGFTNARVTTWSIGDGVVNTGTTTAAGLVDLSLGTVNAQVSTLYLGRAGATGTGGGATQGTLTIGGGTFNVNTVFLGYQPNANTAGKTGTGTLNINSNNGVLVVNGNLNIASCATTGDATGTLNINGGSVWASNIVCGAGNSTISIYGGALVLTNAAGTAAAGLNNLNLSNTILQISGASGVAPIVATNVTVDFSTTDTNLINISALPSITSFPTVIPLIQSPNPVTLQFGSFNFALGSLPAGYKGQIILGGVNNNLIELQVNSGPQAPSVWTGADISNLNTNWTDAANWSSASVPGTNSLAIFNSSAAQTSSALSAPGGGPGAILASKLNNIANSNFTVTSLTYTNVGGNYENTSIAPNDAVTLAGGFLTVGSAGQDFGNTTGNVTISGPGGTLNALNPAGSFYVSLGTAIANGSTPRATLDLSGLGMLVSSNASLLIGVGGYSVGSYLVPQPSGVVYLAQTNVIYAGSAQPDSSDASPVALEVGDADTQAGLPSALYLGWSNAIYADNISIARRLGSGWMGFNSAVTSANPTAYIRGFSAGAVANWTIGDGVANSTAALASSGTNDFNGGTVNALANTLFVGKNSSGVGAGGQVAGTLNFNAGNINVNTLNVSYNGAASDGNVYNSSAGTVNVGGTGVLVVNSIFNLAYVAGSPAFSATPTGALNITNGGAVWANAIVPGTNGGASIININNGTLIVSNTAGTPSVPLTSLSATNATLFLVVGYNPAVIAATTVNTGGATNTINISSLPPSAAYPFTLTLIQSAKSISPFNFGLGLNSLPAGYNGTITKSADGTAVVLTISSGPVGVRPYVLWDGADSAHSTNWSDAQNWQFPGAPVAGDTVIFNNTGSVSGSPFNTLGAGAAGIVQPNNINNVVDQNFTVGSLTFTNAGGVYQNTLIGSNLTMTTSNLTVGNTTFDFGGTATEFVTFAGRNGTLAVNNTNANVFIGLDSAAQNPVSSGQAVATLDLSGLGTFTASVATFAVGALATTATYPAGVLYLAQTNTITATGGAPAETGQDETLSLLIGETGKGATSESFLYLGQMNTFNANSLGVGIAKQTGAMQFNAGLAGTPVAVFRGADGVSAVSTWAVGDGVGQSGSSSAPTGTVDFSLGSVNALVGTMYLGRSPNVSGGHAGTGVLTLGAGTFSVSTLYDGYQAFSDSDFGAGTINVNGPGTLMVSGNLYLAATTGGAGASTTTGTLIINGGAVQASQITADPTGNSAITLAGGLLLITRTAGSPGAPLTTLNLSGGTLQLNVNGGAIITNLVATSVNTNSGTTIQIVSLTGAATGVTYPLLSYTGTDPFGSLKLALPSGYTGSLVDNSAGGIVGLTLTVVPPPKPPRPAITGVTVSGTTLNLSATNGAASGQYILMGATNLATPLTNWVRILTNNFNGGGNLILSTNIINPAVHQEFYLILQP